MSDSVDTKSLANQALQAAEAREVKESESLRREILNLVSRFHGANWPEKQFVPGKTPVPVSGRVFDGEDLVHLVDSSLDFWLTTGRFAEEFEQTFADFLGVKHALLCNSGSSANLLAVAALTSPRLGRRRLQDGDEVITVAAGFPTTVNPIIQNNLIPVFLDVELTTCNVDVQYLEDAVSPKTKAIILAHTLGNPFNLDAVTEFAAKHDLWLVEDNCDALGSKYKGRMTGSFGDLSTESFYPAHHITMGEGGCVMTSNGRLKMLVESFRDWGRDCWCAPGKDNTCGKRFGWCLGELPEGYDHKYIYSHVGYNLKATDMQAAIGVSQLKKLPVFIEARRKNWRTLFDLIRPLEEFLILPEPTPLSDPSWFGFLITVRPGSPFTRTELVKFLESRQIATRQMFGGNLTRQPAYQNAPSRKIGNLNNSDIIMNNSFWVGVFPGITGEMLEYMAEAITEFVEKSTNR